MCVRIREKGNHLKFKKNSPYKKQLCEQKEKVELMKRKTKMKDKYMPLPNKETIPRTAIKSKELSDDGNS
jgi:hypothetical protein